MIDKNDVDILKLWLTFARTEGTDRIKIVVGDKPDTWVVTVVPKYRYAGSVMGRLQLAEPSITEMERAKCNKCKSTFPFIPKKLNSTKTGICGIYPRCPVCHSYRETVVERG